MSFKCDYLMVIYMLCITTVILVVAVCYVVITGHVPLWVAILLLMAAIVLFTYELTRCSCRFLDDEVDPVSITSV